MQQHSKISASSYSSYIKFTGTSLNPAKALEMYNSISDESTKNNVFICNSVLRCLVRNGKFDSSMKLFRKMKHNGLIPDAITYSTVCKILKHHLSFKFATTAKYMKIEFLVMVDTITLII